MDIEFWFPSYGNNLGVVSKLLKLEIVEITNNFGITIEDTYFKDNETFYININVEKMEYFDYIHTKLKQRYGTFSNSTDLQEGDAVLGRLINPGKVGFGIFVDIGIREPKQDILLPLYQLREDFLVHESSTREIVQNNGLIDGFPLLLEITEIVEKKGNKQINAKISDTSKELFTNWNNANAEKLLVTKEITSHVTNSVRKLKLDEYIERIEALDPLTSVIHCKKGTRADGLIPLLGPHLKRSPIGIFTSNSIIMKK